MLAGKVVIVTGATSGIGRHAATLFAQRGANVVLAGRRLNEGAAVVEEMRAAGFPESIFVQTDVTQDEDCENLVTRALETFGKLDGAFNNAGISMEADKQAPHLVSAETFKRTLDVDLVGCFQCMKHQVGAMLNNPNGGSIVSCGSIFSHRGLPLGMPSYTAAKHALLGLNKSFALAYADKGIRCNTVSPAWVESELTQDYPTDRRELITALHPAGRWLQADEVSASAAFLLSDDSKFVNAQSIVLDSGMTSALAGPAVLRKFIAPKTE